MSVRTYVIKPSPVYHAELIGPLRPRERASHAQIVEMLERSDDDDAMSELREICLEDVNRRYGGDLPVRYQMPDLSLGRFAPRERAPDPSDMTGLGRNGGDRIGGALVATQQIFRRTGSLSQTARALGLSVCGVRARLVLLRIKALRRQGIDIGSARQNRIGRVVRTHIGRPTLDEQRRRRAPVLS